MAYPDCKMIEKCIKDMLFKNNSDNDSSVQIDQNISSYANGPSFDNRCLVSNIEKDVHMGKNSSFGGLSPMKDNLNSQSGVSELIDLNVLTDFAAKHIDDSNLNTSEMVLNCENRILPHPELEDDHQRVLINTEGNQRISMLFDNISKEIQNSSKFFNTSQNMISKPTISPEKNTIINGCLDNDDFKTNNQVVFDKRLPNKKKKAQKKMAKEKRMKERMSGLYVPKENNGSSSGSPEKGLATEVYDQNITRSPIKRDPKTSEKKNTKTSANIQDIKIRKSVFSSVGREYSLTNQNGICKFQCHICKYNTDIRECVTRHLNSRSHKELKEQNDLDMMLPFLPVPLEGQTEAITELIKHNMAQFGLQKEDMDIRERLIYKLKKFVQDNLSICTVDAIGSSVTALGLKNTEVDFVLRVSAEGNIPDALEKLFAAIHSSEFFDKVFDDFKKKRPRILFRDRDTNLSCNIVIDNGSSLKLANLLSTYSKLDHRVQPLATSFRYWANLCEIDEQDCGTLPSFSFAILLVHFLQQINPPVLPVLHELKDFASTPEFCSEYISENKWHSTNTDSLGELWIKLFQFYNFNYKIGEDVICIRSSKRVTCAERSWSTKFYAIEDPFLRRNLAYVIPTYQVCQYIQQCFVKTYRYFAYPQLKDVSIKLLKTDAFDSFMLSELVSSKPLIKEDTSEESDTSENEDSFLQEPLDFHPDLEDHDPDIPIVDLISTITALSLKEVNCDESNSELADELSKIPTDSSELSDEMSKVSVDTSDIPPAAIADSIQPTAAAATLDKKECNDHPLENPSKLDVEPDHKVMCFWDVEERVFNIESFNYKFDARRFRGENRVPLICRLCKSTGHQKKDCPNDDIPVPEPLPEMTVEHLAMVNKVLYYIRDKNAVTDSDMKFMVTNMKELQNHIREVFPDATLSLFGSFCNGFGFKNRSDMDFCLTFGDRDDAKDLDCTDVIEKVAEQLRHHPTLENIVPVTSAKVPIVKFACKESGLEGDISLYNTLAIANTEMLEAYSKIDSRVQILGFALKYFAKVLGICDASRGSLSSYAYILMVIFYLQQRNPPVIPVLQELHGEEKPSELKEGWNVWFFRDLDKLAEAWPDYGKNKESVSELWLGLLSFYTCDFNWKKYIISIRQKSLMNRFRKLWYTRQIAIEDPFELNHNLGAGLSQKMNSYIIKALIRARERFGTPLPLQKILVLHGHEMGYLFDRRFLNSNCEPPHDRGCRYCGKIGHIAKNCNQEKCCLFCGRSGHLVKACPKKNRWKRSKESATERSNSQERFVSFEKRNSAEKQNAKGNLQRNQNSDLTIKNNALLPHAPPNCEDIEGQRKFLQLGLPTHRFGPPGYPPRGFMSNPPPGFMPGVPVHQNNMNYPPPFGIQNSHVSSPFPRATKINEIHSQSPPKHYSSSPPKNLMANKSFQQVQDSPWANSARSGIQVERHPVPPERVGYTPWQHRSLIQRDPLMHHQSNQSQNLDHRAKRTSSENLYNPNHSQRW